MNNKVGSFARHCISIIIVGGLAYYCWKHWDIFHSTLRASWYHILGLVLCILVTWVLNCYQVLLLLRGLGVKVGFWENALVLVAMILGNYLPMRLGSLLRMRYFKKVHGLKYSKFIGIAGVRTLILLISAGILGCISVIGLNLSGIPFNIPLLSIFVSMTAISIVACLIPAPRTHRSKYHILKVWSDFYSAFDAIQSHHALFWQIMGLVLTQFAVVGIRLHISFDAMQVKLSPWVFLMLAPMATLIAFLSLTPGSLGLREWAIGLISLASGIDFSSGIFAGTIDRAVLMACTFVFGSGSLAYVWFRTENGVAKKTANTASTERHRMVQFP